MASRDPEPVASPYWEVRVVLPAEAPVTEAVTNLLWEQGALGVVEEGTGAEVRLRAFWPPGADVRAVAHRTRAYLDELRALALPVGPARLDVEPLADPGWADAWRAHFRPLAVGHRLLVCPPWERPPDGLRDRLVVWVEPGRAFGTGGHATTRGCLELLEGVLAGLPVSQALDAGCGSGILAIAAARLGVPHVDALDVDPDAVAATETNVRLNAVTERVRASLGAVETWAGPPVPLVLANLLAAAHLELASVFARLVTPGGALVAGGILGPEAAAVTGRLEAAGFHPETAVEREGWASLCLRRVDPGLPG